MSEDYINKNFAQIKKYANIIETRLDDYCAIESILEDNKRNLDLAKKYDLNYILIEDEYSVNIDL